MIFVSSSAVKSEKIIDAVKTLADAGFSNIELSGGTKYYEGYSNDLYNLKNDYNLNFLLHNYFPPPRKEFVLNLASLNDEIYYMSMDHVKKAIDLSIHLEAEKYAFHSGFLLDISLNEIGKIISNEKLFDSKRAMDRFINSINELTKYANGEVDLYIENNVISKNNFDSFDKNNPFFFTFADEYFDISKRSEIKPLIDMAHLFVSSNTLELDFEQEFDKLFEQTDYIHLSSNNGDADRNEAFSNNHIILNTLNKYDLSNKTFTLEIYDDLVQIRNSYKLLEKIIYGKESKMP
jgi:sugar phosphate isomerase/epimerase